MSVFSFFLDLMVELKCRFLTSYVIVAMNQSCSRESLEGNVFPLETIIPWQTLSGYVAIVFARYQVIRRDFVLDKKIYIYKDSAEICH